MPASPSLDIFSSPSSDDDAVSDFSDPAFEENPGAEEPADEFDSSFDPDDNPSSPSPEDTATKTLFTTPKTTPKPPTYKPSFVKKNQDNLLQLHERIRSILSSTNVVNETTRDFSKIISSNPNPNPKSPSSTTPIVPSTAGTPRLASLFARGTSDTTFNKVGSPLLRFKRKKVVVDSDSELDDNKDHGENLGTNTKNLDRRDHNDSQSDTSDDDADHKDGSLDFLINQSERHRERLIKAIDDSSTMNSESITIPPSLNATLHKHQLIALKWLSVLHYQNVNCILADEMGLGKTISCIAFLALLDHEKRANGVHLIIVPASIILNWESEFGKFCPSLNVFIYYGSIDDRLWQQSQLKKMKKRGKLPHVIITTYNIVVQKIDKKFFKKFKFDFLILDEAQGIKNASSQRHQRITSFDCNHRLLLTGTPLQNNLKELWSLLSFLMPSLFSGFSIEDIPIDEMDELVDSEEDQLSDTGDEANKDQDKNLDTSTQSLTLLTRSKSLAVKKEKRRAQLRRILQPFILRRLKSVVAPDLPTKTEILEKCDMTTLQSEVYSGILNRELTTDHKGIRDFIYSQSKSKLNNVVMQLRKAANHPHFFRIYYVGEVFDKLLDVLAEFEDQELFELSRSLFFSRSKIRLIKEDMALELSALNDFDIHDLCLRHDALAEFLMPEDDLLWSSGKFLKLRELVTDLISKDHRILIFSQFTSLLDVVEAFCSALNLDFCRLDGSVATLERQPIIDLFNTDQSIKIFLLSTKAGGVGINLTSADTVIFFDSDWNPQNDSQAEDRCHRIGQTKPVTVYRLCSKNSIDKGIIEVAKKKAELNAQLLDGAFTDSKVEKGDDFASILESALFGKED
ncbi:hypothetical protein P9112_012812 [Eukaryota sp. TZLM1-RC]